MEVLGKRRGLAYLLLVLLQGLLAACDNALPEQAISKALAEIKKGIEEGDTSTIMGLVADNITVERRGRTLSRKEIQRTLVDFFPLPKPQHLIHTHQYCTGPGDTGASTRTIYRAALGWKKCVS